MSRIADLRQRAALCRRAAQVHTEGGRREDRVLLIIAAELEREAAELAKSEAAVRSILTD